MCVGLMSNSLIIDEGEEERKDKHVRHSFVFHSALILNEELSMSVIPFSTLSLPLELYFYEAQWPNPGIDSFPSWINGHPPFRTFCRTKACPDKQRLEKCFNHHL